MGAGVFGWDVGVGSGMLGWGHGFGVKEWLVGVVGWKESVAIRCAVVLHGVLEFEWDVLGS